MTQRLKQVVNPTIERFLQHCHRRRSPAKSVIIYAGDTPDSLYYIIEGSVTVLIEEKDGQEIVLAYLNAGDFFGEMGLFDTQKNRSAWVRAKTQCEVAEINYGSVFHLATDTPDIIVGVFAPHAMRLRRTSGMVGRL